MEGVWHGDGTVDEEEAGVCPGARPVDPAGGALVETIPDVNPLHAASPLSECQKRGRRRSNKRRAQREALLSLEAPVPTPQEDLSGATHVPLESGSYLTPPIPSPLHEAIGVGGPGLGNEGWRRANRRQRDRWRSHRANATAASFLRSSSPLSSGAAGPPDPPPVPNPAGTGGVLGSGSGGGL